MTVWISPDLRGTPPRFSDVAIQAVLTLEVLYQRPIRGAQGMAGSLIRQAEAADQWP
ncbi:transposase [Pararoseomonas sp. SCSIO 73927]|uniref:transposase n=1 Tax=Pararoseomonas sp. SCSIO 73927 TaxID=3114537 RepID=UPI0030D3A698